MELWCQTVADGLWVPLRNCDWTAAVQKVKNRTIVMSFGPHLTKKKKKKPFLTPWPPYLTKCKDYLLGIFQPEAKMNAVQGGRKVIHFKQMVLLINGTRRSTSRTKTKNKKRKKNRRWEKLNLKKTWKEVVIVSDASSKPWIVVLLVASVIITRPMVVWTKKLQVWI